MQWRDAVGTCHTMSSVKAIRVVPMVAVLAATSGCATVPVATHSSVAADPMVALAAPPTAGDKRSKLWQASRLDRGYIVILPGAWGESAEDHGIVDGLIAAGTDAAIEVYAWPADHFPSGPFMVPYNLRATSRNRDQAREVAAKIVRYQEAHPGRPVHVIGYSGGGGIATWTLEELPDDHRVTSAILLAPTLSSCYDFSKALAHTDHGIDSFYSLYDVPVMMAACSIVGTTDGSHRLAGGAIGFRQPTADGVTTAVVRQHSYTLAMLGQGHPGGHFGWTRKGFVTAHVAPLLSAPAVP